MTKFICKYCSKEYNKPGIMKNHQIRCKDNPDRIIQRGGGSGGWNRGLTKDVDPRVAHKRETKDKIRRSNKLREWDGHTDIFKTRQRERAVERQLGGGDAGDFKAFSKRFFGLSEITPQTTTPVAAAVPAPTSQQAQPAAPAKLSYYQRQKLKKDAIKQAAAQAEAERVAAEKAAAELKAKEEEENRRAKAAAQKSMSKEDFDKIVAALGEDGSFSSYLYTTPERDLKRLFDFDVVPDLYTYVAEQLHHVSYGMYNISNAYSYSDIQNYARAIRQPLAGIEHKTGHKISIEQMVLKAFKDGSYTKRANGARYVCAVLANGTPITSDFYRNTIFNLDLDGVRMLANLLTQAEPSVTNQVLDVMASSAMFIDHMKMHRGPVYAVFDMSRAWGGNVTTFNYPSSYSGLAEFGVRILTHINEPFDEIVKHAMSVDTYAYTSIANALAAYGLDGVQINGLGQMYVGMLRPMFEKFMKSSFANGYEDVKKRIFTEHYQYLKYNEASSTKGGPLMASLHDEYAVDIVKQGWDKSKLAALLKVKMSDYKVKHIIKGLGVDVDRLVDDHPNDVSSIYFKAVKDGLNTVDSKQLANAVLTEAGPAAKAVDIIRAGNSFISNAFGDRDANSNAIATALLEIAKTRPNDFANKSAGESMMKLLPYSTQDTTIAWLKLAKDNNNQWIMGSELYKSLHKSYKQDYVDTLTGIVQDCIGSDVEDFVNGIMEGLAPHVVQKMRGNLVGASMLIDNINKGDIKPFDKIDSARLKKIFLYNDINMASILSGVVEKKKKSETYTQYFNRAKQATTSKDIMQRAKVDHDPSANAKAINKIMIQRDHAGKHGDTYPKIDKVFDAHIEYPEFWEFRKRKPKDGSVVPAYHGTGGIAAGMILRYGFKVIKSSDPSVVGRMLGDGIYFSNKIDKVSQYVSNGGYSRKHGQKGYILELDTNLGTKNVDYRAAGVGGGDNIRSPEWCVVDPKAQLRIVKAYEVELVSKSTVDQYLKEGVHSTGMLGFKQYLKEQDMFNIKNATSFVFRDGMIPIVDQESSEVSYVDFEEALAKKLIAQDMFEVTGQGPAIVFQDTPEQVLIDERFASHMGGDDLQLYIQLFRNKMFGG